MLSTVGEIIDALGGTAAVATLCGVGETAVSNWRSRREIPADKFMIFTAALGAAGKTVNPSVFGFEAPRRPDVEARA